MRIVPVILSILIAVSASYSQDVELTGVIYDENGALIAGASVAAKSSAKAVETRSDDDGRYRLSLSPGFYKLVYLKDGFAGRVIERFRLVRATTFSFDVVLEVCNSKTCDHSIEVPAVKPTTPAPPTTPTPNRRKSK